MMGAQEVGQTGVGDESSCGHGESEVPVGQPRGGFQVVGCTDLGLGEQV